jgi:hypothetical protein
MGGEGVCIISWGIGAFGAGMRGLWSRGVTRASEVEESEIWDEGSNPGVGCMFGGSALKAENRVFGVGDLVIGRESKVEEGEAADDTLPSRGGLRTGLLLESYGFGRFGAVVTSFFLLEGARFSTTGKSVIKPPDCCQAALMADRPFANSVWRAAGAVLWSSVIIIGREEPVPIMRPAWSSMVKCTLKPTFSR